MTRSNDSQVWSDYTTFGASGTDIVFPPSNSFDGNLTTRANKQDAVTWTWAPPAITYLDKVEVFWTADLNGANYAVNNVAQGTLGADGNWLTVLTGGGTLTRLFTDRGTNAGVGFAAIRVDGKLLVDPGVRNLGDTEVTGPVKRGEGTIDNINDTNVLIHPFVDNAFVPDQYLVHKEPKVINVTPLSDSINSYDTGSKTLTLAGNKDLIEFAFGDQVTMTDAAGAPATYTPVTSEITGTNSQVLNMVASNWGSPGRALNGDQSTKASSLNFSATDTDEWGTIDFGQEIDVTSFNAFTRIIAVPNQFRLVDEAGNVVHLVQDFPSQGENPTTIYNGLPIKARYYQQRVFHQGVWTSDDFHTFNLNGPQVSCQDVDVAAGTGKWNTGNVIIDFTDNNDLKYFNTGDIITNNDIVTQSFVFKSQAASGGCNGAYYPTEVRGCGEHLCGITETVVYPGNKVYFEVSTAGVDGRDTASTSYFGAVAKDTLCSSLGVGGQNGAPGWSTEGNTTNLRNAGPGAYTQWTAGSSCMVAWDVDAKKVWLGVNGVWPTTPGDPDANQISVNGGPTTEYQVHVRALAERPQMYISPGSEANCPEGFTPITEQVVRNTYQVVLAKPDSNQLVVSGGNWRNGDTITGPAKSGTGTVSVSNPADNSITLQVSNDQWIDNYHVKGPTKPAVSMTAYLNFDQNGNVNGLQSAPYSTLMLDTFTPKLTFPATFSTGDTPDVTIPAPSYLQTAVTGIGIMI